MSLRLAIDTNVVVAAFRSPTGASARILEAADEGRFQWVCSVAVFLEYEDVLKRPQHRKATGLSLSQIDAALRDIASIVAPTGIERRLRPRLSDPDDEMVFELAILGRVDALVTFETRTFSEALYRAGVEVMIPRLALARILGL